MGSLLSAAFRRQHLATTLRSGPGACSGIGRFASRSVIGAAGEASRIGRRETHDARRHHVFDVGKEPAGATGQSNPMENSVNEESESLVSGLAKLINDQVISRLREFAMSA